MLIFSRLVLGSFTRKWPGLGENVFKIDYQKLLGEAPAEGEEA
jgi:hypothetical protein